MVLVYHKNFKQLFLVNFSPETTRYKNNFCSITSLDNLLIFLATQLTLLHLQEEMGIINLFLTYKTCRAFWNFCFVFKLETAHLAPRPVARARHCIEPRLFCLLLSGAFGLMEIKHYITSFPRRLTVSVIRTTIGTIQKCDGTTTVNRFVVRCTTSVYTYLARTRSPLVSSNITGIIADNKKTQCQFSAKFSKVLLLSNR